MFGISSIYILDQKGRVLITRQYRNELPANIHETFNKKLLEFDEYTQKPVMIDKDGYTYIFIRHNNLIFMTVCSQNANCLMIFSFLFRLVQVLQEYFVNVEEESIRDNFVVVYELLDEMLDNGYPQTTEFKILKEFIKTESFQLKEKKQPEQTNFNVVALVSNKISWRKEGIKYKKNEVFLDVIEKLNILIGQQGNVIKSEIIGQVQVKCMLSGMPELKLGLNDKAFFEAQGRQARARAVEFDDIKFHQCVRLSKFENERVIQFIPPDGDFELISYRLDIRVKPLFSVDVLIERKSTTKIEFLVKAKSNFKPKSTANNVEIFVPVPEDAEQPQFRTAHGSVNYMPEKEAMCWSIKQFGGQRDFMMNAVFHLPTIVSPNRDKFQKMPINITFEIPYFTVSGFQVRYLKIQDKSGYNALPWVRYITQNGEYQIRMN
ncbi:unnamed protein product [Paramecium sonneborni]|uniref:MHD domain-containing protein n=1 Tax=Paramecium sonneborni TaxID=65129 RepID=A0A8S1PTA1_9CILI|nr:unnamed protein product [Paramecium sonneborni]